MKQLEDRQRMQVSDLPFPPMNGGVKLSKTIDRSGKHLKHCIQIEMKRKSSSTLLPDQTLLLICWPAWNIMEPLVDLMLRVQSLHTPVWKLKLWWPRVKAKLSEAASRVI